jgi:diketogulonate reductase-like aldo/keto reductase
MQQLPPPLLTIQFSKLAYGTGTYWIKESADSIDRPTVDGIKAAIELGYRHLDGAQCKILRLLSYIQPML